MSFTLSQEVSRHIKQNACQLPSTSLNSSMMWNCSKCLFTTDSQAECFFHEVLHRDPVKVYKKDVSGKETVVLKYECPLCSKAFRKQSLRSHLRQHTYERPFVCSTCGTSFSRPSTLTSHVKKVHGQGIGKMTELKKLVIPVKNSVKDSWICSKCSKKFTKRYVLCFHFIEIRSTYPHEETALCFFNANS